MERCSEFSIVGRVASWMLVAFAGIAAVWNIAHGKVHRPLGMVLILLGFALFLVGKLSVILKKKRISFGPSLMTTLMANAYRLGYWFMVVGILVTFV